MIVHIRSVDSVTKPTSQFNTYSRYVGRVGALAAALGIGMMVATTPCIASADSTNTGSTSTGASADGGADSSGAAANTGTTGAGTATNEAGAGVSSSGTGTATSSIANSPATATASVDTNTPGVTSSIQLAPGVSISANSIRIGKHTVTLGLGALKPPTGTSGVATQPKSPDSIASGQAVDPVQGSVPPVDPVPEAGQTTSTLVKAEAKSAHPTPVNAAPALRSAAASTLASASATVVDDVLKSAKKLSVSVTESNVATTVQALKFDNASSALASPSVASVVSPVAPSTQIAQISTGVVGILNQVVTKLLNPFLAPAPNTPEPVSPVLWAVLGWVRRNLFNQAPAFTKPITSEQIGQTVTGSLGATDPENDALTYTITKQPEHGTVTIDQATGTYTYTPNDINYTAAQTDSFSVSVSDGSKVNLLGLFQPRTAQETVDVKVLSPTVSRVILDLPDDIKSPANPRYSEDGKSIFFAARPAAGGRTEIYQINVDGTGVQCVTCGVTTSETGNLAKPVPVTDGSGRVLVLVQDGNQPPRYSILEKDANGNAQLVRVETPDGGGLSVAPNAGIIDRQREMRVSPDRTHVLFTRIVVGQTGGLQAVPIVGELTRVGDHYEVTNAKVVYPTGEGKQWTPDGKGVVILGGQFDAGNVDDIEVDLATGKVTRVTANPDYDEDMDYSPNEQWIAIGSTRGLDALTPMTRIQRQNFLPVYVGAPVYLQYATPVNVSNQEWAVAVDDELNRENGLPLFDGADGYAARSMPSWNPSGDAVTFWESSVQLDPATGQPVDSRLVIVNLKYTTSVGPVAADRSTAVSQTAFPSLGTYVAKTTPLPPVGTYAGVNGGTAVVTEYTDATGHTTRNVVYHNYVNEDGLILNGTESADYGASQNSVHYVADIDITDATGKNRGYLVADATVNAFTQSMTGYITSSLDNDVETIPDPDQAHAAQQSA